LRGLHNPRRAEGVQRYFKGAVVALGIDASTLRSWACDQLKLLKPNWGADQAASFCDRMLREPELEIRGAGILILGGFHQAITPSILPLARRWLEECLTNWALVDGFCSSVLSPLLKQHPDTEKTLRAWTRARSLWVRRASLVTLVPLARRGQLLDSSYELASAHFADPEDLMHKATGWLLREAGKTDPERLRAFLLLHGAAIPRTALRYAIERFPASERAVLLEKTRPL